MNVASEKEGWSERGKGSWLLARSEILIMVVHSLANYRSNSIPSYIPVYL